MMKHIHDPQYAEISDERRMVLDDVCSPDAYTKAPGQTAAEKEACWDRIRKARESRLAHLHQVAIAAKAKWDASGNPADEVAYIEAFERWIGE